MALADVLLKVQNAIAKVGRDGTNPHTKSGYPTLEAVLDVLNPQLEEHGITIKQHPAFTESQWVLKTTVGAGSDSESFDMPLLGLQDAKNPMQALGSAITYARRYSLMAYFKLAPTDDDGIDADGPSLTIIPEKKPEARAPKDQKKDAKNPPPAKDMKIPDGKFKGKMLSAVPREDLKAYVDDILAAMGASGKKPPKWFDQIREASGL